MDPPPAPPISTAPAPLTTATTTQTTTYADSIDSSPRSRATDFDDSFPPTNPKLRLMCSYGGHIVPRPHDKSLCYVGGDTRMVVVDRASTLSDLLNRLSKTLLNNRPFTLKYQLPNEDLDSLITVSTDEDLDNMVDEYDRLCTNTGSANSSNSSKSSRIRLFLFPAKPEGTNSIGSILDGSNRSEDWFLNALNGAAALQRGFSDPASVNCLLGLDDGGNLVNSTSNDNLNITNSNNFKEGEVLGSGENKVGKLGNPNNNINNNNQDVHSVPDSPIIETTSSFGSTSSSPSLANLPPIRVHVEEGVRVLEQRVGPIGIEEQFAQMGLGSGGGGFQKQQGVDESSCFVMLSSPPPSVIVAGVPVGGGGGGVEFTNRVYSDDERSDHGVPVGYRKQQMGQPVMSSQAPQQKQMGGELPSPDSVSSDSSLSNAISRQKQVMYQDPGSQLSSGSNRLAPNMVDPNTRIQMQQVSESGYTLHPQFEQHQQQLLHQQQQLLQQHQQQHHQQQQAQTQPQNQQQYIPASAHFVHHPPPGAVPMSGYYPVYPHQQPQHHPHQYPVYYMPAGQAQGYSLPVQQQPNMGEAATSIPSGRSQIQPNPTIITTSSAYNPTRNVPPSKSEMASGVYRTTTAASPQLVQVPPSQHQTQSQTQPQQQQQFMGYSQMHHPSQSLAPNSAATAGYAYDFSDPAHVPIYYTQPLAPTVASQYQGVTSAPAMVMPDGSTQLPNDNVKQQMRSS